MKLERIYKNIKAEIKKHPKTYFFLALILLSAFFVRTYRLNELLGFYFDQGRDALVIWKLWHEGRPFLIGPVTGLAGIFLGPFYYYLISPFYLIGGGNPVYPAVFLAFLATVGIFFLYFLGEKMQDKNTGLIATIIAAFSLELVKAGRWLANPTPILLTSMLLLWSMWEIVYGKGKKWWIFIALIVGLSLQLEVASAVFYIPMVVVFAAWQRKKLPGKKTILISLLIFFASLVPQIAFNFRHDNILFDNFKKVLFDEKSFTLSIGTVLVTRINYFWSVFNSKLLPGKPEFVAGLLVIIITLLILKRDDHFRKRILPLFLIFLGVPMVGYILFQGNFGNIYDYYMTGYFYPMILLFSIGLGKLLKENIGKIVVVLFFIQFFVINGTLVRYYIIAGADGPEHITLGNEVQAVNWIYDDAKERGEFNIDVYVPPVIPHSYDYLFLWQGTVRCGKDLCGLKIDRLVNDLYTLYEVDPPHPWRLETWLERQSTIGVVEKETNFGGITVQKRTRI